MKRLSVRDLRQNYLEIRKNLLFLLKTIARGGDCRHMTRGRAISYPFHSAVRHVHERVYYDGECSRDTAVKNEVLL